MLDSDRGNIHNRRRIQKHTMATVGKSRLCSRYVEGVKGVMSIFAANLKADWRGREPESSPIHRDYSPLSAPHVIGPRTSITRNNAQCLKRKHLHQSTKTSSVNFL